MSAFKVGDRVVIVKKYFHSAHLSPGQAGVVVSHVGFYIRVKMDSGPSPVDKPESGWLFSEDELRHESEGGAE